MSALLTYHQALADATAALKRGEVIGYPTEAVYGLGADPFNEAAVAKVIAIKKRNPDKGLILVASRWQQFEALVEPVSPMMRMQIEDTWPGPVTYVFPATQACPQLVRGTHKSIAIRISAHPVVHDLCEHFGGPIVSTSANHEGYPPIRDERTLTMSFGDELAVIVPGDLGGNQDPSQIIDAVSGERLR